MEEEYSPEILACLDEIIERLKQKNYITIQPGKDTEIQRICYEILVDEKWITVQRIENKIVFQINPSSSFSRLYAGGTFSKRYERKKQSQHKSINITNSTLINSPIAQGNNISQNIFDPNISSEINNAINQIEGEQSLTSQEKKRFFRYSWGDKRMC